MQPFLRYLAAFITSTLIALLAIPVSASPLGGCGSVFNQNFDGVTPPALPSGWVASQGVNVTGAPLWVTSTVTPQTSPNDVFSTAPDNILDNRLDTPVLPISPTTNLVTFWHSYNLNSGFDGAVLEISSPDINGGVFTDVTAAGGQFFGGGYNATISASFQSPIAGRMAWSGNSGGYIFTQLFFPMVSFSQAKLRFRLVSDNAGASAGWRIDTFSVVRTECSSPTPTASPTPPVTPSPTPTATATVTPTATIFPTATPSASDCPGVCGSPTPSPTVTPTATAPPTPTPSLTPSPTPAPSPAQALNISTRLRVETGDRIMIGGFIITGSAPKRVALRGLGPSLSNSGLSDLLADPTLELRGSDGALLLQNDNWQDDPFGGKQIAALGLAPQHPNESGMVATLPPGAYTALMAGKNQTSGIGLMEIYDTDPAADSQLANLSTRGFVRMGDNVMIGGFILDQGSGSANVVVRGIGPSLSQFGLSNVLADPTLELRDSNGALLIANDNWQDNPTSAAQLTARGFALPNPLESGIFATLPPGLFTAILAGKNGGVGLGLVEIYNGVDGNTPTVTSTADSGPGSLRAAIAAAGDGDTIQFDAALIGQVITLTSGELVIDKNITIRGPGEPNLLTVWTGLIPLSFRIFHVMPGRFVTIEGLTIYGGHPNTSGGGILNDQATLTINSCTVDRNFSGVSGGGISNQGASAMLTIVNSNVTTNSASGTGGGLGGGIDNSGTVLIRNSSVSGNTVNVFPALHTGTAGGISNGGMMTISNSTISGNSAGIRAGGIINGGTMTITGSTVRGNSLVRPGYGGGIFNGGPLTITNSTISDNSAIFQASSFGGGIYNGGPLTITNSTFSGNTSDSGHGGGIYHGHSTLDIGNTILKAGSSGANLNVAGSDPGTVISYGYNLSSDDGGGFLTATGDQINTDPMLGPLQDNGGLTFTHALLTGSAAINAGDPSFTPPPIYDQRGPGYDRVVNGRIDIGSFEAHP
jgi:hypothetical protein